MFKSTKADKDAYITNKIIRGVNKVSGNVGIAGSLDLYKLFGVTVTGSLELTRLLVHFDLAPIIDLHNSKKIDISDESFFCKLSLKDVYGGQTTPRNFTVSVFPLSASFQEGLGKDVVYLSENDACNWLSSSFDTRWYEDGCSFSCSSTSAGDFITSSYDLQATEAKQTFVTGEEDLIVDVTKIVSATIKGDIPDSGFRISFSSSLENDDRTYFVKRFGSRHSFDESKHPRLYFGFNDSITDDINDIVFDVDCSINLYNYIKGQATDLLSGTAHVTGSNCLALNLLTEISGGYHTLIFSGSQFALGQNFVSGVYTATINIPSSDQYIATKISQSGSVEFIPIWTSSDSSYAFVTGSVMTAKLPQRNSSVDKSKNYSVSVTNTSDKYAQNEDVFLRVNIQDYTDPLLTVSKLPVELPGIVARDAYYSVRDAITNEIVIPFDDVHLSTKISNDDKGMFFIFSTDSLTVGRTYVIDIMVSMNGIKKRYMNASSAFTIVKSDEG